MDCTPAQGERARFSLCRWSASIPSPLAECLRVENDPAAMRLESKARRCRASLERGRARKPADDRMQLHGSSATPASKSLDPAAAPLTPTSSCVQNSVSRGDPLAEPLKRERSIAAWPASRPTVSPPQPDARKRLPASPCCGHGGLRQAEGPAQGHLQSSRHEIQAVRCDRRHSQRRRRHRQVRRVFLGLDGGLLQRVGGETRENCSLGGRGGSSLAWRSARAELCASAPLAQARRLEDR